MQPVVIKRRFREYDYNTGLPLNWQVPSDKPIGYTMMGVGENEQFILREYFWRQLDVDSTPEKFDTARLILRRQLEELGVQFETPFISCRDSGSK